MCASLPKAKVNSWKLKEWPHRALTSSQVAIKPCAEQVCLTYPSHLEGKICACVIAKSENEFVEIESVATQRRTHTELASKRNI